MRHCLSRRGRCSRVRSRSRLCSRVGSRSQSGVLCSRLGSRSQSGVSCSRVRSRSQSGVSCSRVRSRSLVLAVLGVLAVVMLAGCHQDMWNQPKYRGLRASELYADGKSARDLVPGTVAYGDARGDEAYYTGQVEGEFVGLPMPATLELLRRGQERFNIYCTPCHGFRGDGLGYITTRGMPRPTNFHTEALRQRPEGYFVDVMTHGFGMMYSYASRVSIEDRWAIAAYIRALQLSQFATMADLPMEDPTAYIEENIRNQIAPAGGRGNGEG
jgi:mono/diheme cytochrome c family protein